MDVYKYKSRLRLFIFIISIFIITFVLTSFSSLPKTKSTKPRPLTLKKSSSSSSLSSSSNLPIKSSSLPPIKLQFNAIFNFTNDLQFILNTIYHEKIEIFLLEPCILWQFLSHHNQNKLITRKSVNNLTRSCNLTTSNGYNLFTFGLLQPYSISIWKQLQLKLSLSNVKISFEPNDEQVKHIIISSNYTIVHIAIIYQRGNMHMINSLTNLNDHNLNNNDLRIGQYESAFELISLIAIKLNHTQYILIPDDTLKYLFELPHSQFIECRHDLAKKWNNQYALTDKVQIELNDTLSVIRNIIFNHHVPIWMDGGSLLGWARHCSAIVHERDADFASWAEINNNGYDLTIELTKSVKSPWYFIETFGLPWTAYELRLYNVKLDWQVDLFFMTQDEIDSKSVYSGYHTFPSVSYYKFYYEKSYFHQLCSGEIYGSKILIPCRFDDVLKDEYGDKWIIPDTHHFLKPQKRSHKSSWKLNEAPFAYQCLGRYQFDVKQMNYSHYKYEPNIHEKDTTFDPSIQMLLQQYKTVCNHFRWDRTS